MSSLGVTIRGPWGSRNVKAVARYIEDPGSISKSGETVLRVSRGDLVVILKNAALKQTQPLLNFQYERAKHSYEQI